VGWLKRRQVDRGARCSASCAVDRARARGRDYANAPYARHCISRELEALRCATHAVSLGDVRTLVVHPQKGTAARQVSLGSSAGAVP
jgi:hypothetical protein